MWVGIVSVAGVRCWRIMDENLEREVNALEYIFTFPSLN